ncbi:MAG: thiamine pyrophosphate-dependent dehydrogenase E1 component subunit alpha [Verrucomicrobiales bacterium]|nr:thiamine pyrophosphate-dependent dehydrogenase E1 component subunit alpha [Verrucomicrobiales bacterium]
MESSSPTVDSPETDRDASNKKDAYRWMVLARTFEDKIGALYRAGKVVGGVYLGRGQEAFSVSLGVHLDQARGDVFAGLIRDQAGRMAFGESILDAARTYLGSASGPMRGRDGNIHRGRPREGLPAMISHLGASISVTNGYLMAKRAKGESGFVGGATAGDGATSTGAFHEGINQAAVEKLPLVVAVADNQFAYSTPTASQYACQSLVERAKGYGLRGVEIDGTDLSACLDAFWEAVSRARSGEGPQLVVGKLLRLAGHGEHDDASYVPDSVKAGKYGRDCLEVAREQLLADGVTEAELSEMADEVQEEVEAAVSQAQGEDPPSPITDDWKAISTDSLLEGER